MAAGKAGSKVERVGELLCGRQQETRNPPRAFAGLKPRLSRAVSDTAAVGQAGWVSPGCSLAAGVRTAGLTAADGGGDPPPAAQGGHGARSPQWGQTMSCCTQPQGCAELGLCSRGLQRLTQYQALNGISVRVCAGVCVVLCNYPFSLGSTDLPCLALQPELATKSQLKQ